MNEFFANELVSWLLALGVGVGVGAGWMWAYRERECHHAQASLRESEATRDALMSAMPDLLIRMKGDGTYLGIVSSDRLSVLNADRAAAGNINIYDILPKDVADLRMHYIRRALQTGSTQIYEQQIDLGDRVQHEEVRIVIVREDEVLNIIRDITDRKQAEEALRHSEERLRGLIANIPGAIYRCRFQGDWHIEFMSEAIAALTGYSAADLLKRHEWTLDSLVHPDDRHGREHLLGQAIDTRQPYQMDYRIVHREGETRWIHERGRVTFDGNGQPLWLDGAMFDISDRKQAEAIAAMNEALQLENLRMGAELNVARQIQRMILPGPQELEIEGLDISGYMEPADEVGGDYYDVLYTDDVVTVSIGDVTGHGLESGLLMLMAQTAVRTLKEVREEDPIRFLATLNRAIYKNVQRMNSSKNLSLVVLNYEQGRLSISGQHEETLIVRRNGEVERIDTVELGFPIGLDDDIAEFIQHAFVELAPGDGVVLYTDGIPESIDMQKRLYGVERLCELVSANWERPAAAIVHAVIEDVRTHIGSQKVYDDITLLILKRVV